ncbi:MAG: YicC/YloC family endoribonuclease [Clostridiaceae bacterium]
MVRSMTGFGKASDETDGRSLDLEFKSVNSRYLDINIRMPKTLFSLEDRIKKQLSSGIARGKVDVFLTYRNYNTEDLVVRVNSGAAEKYVGALREITNQLEIIDDIASSFLLKLDGVIVMEDKPEDLEKVWNLVSAVLSRAMATHDSMRVSEGENLKRDMLEKRDVILAKTQKIQALSVGMTGKYREKLTERLNELNQLYMEDDRIAQEVALFADRASIDEEITRLNSHMEQLKEILNLDEPVGRKLDFLAQEMNREANTMASKSVDLEITELVLDIKSEIEKIREQIQNIE